MEAKDSKFEESTTIEKDKVLLNREWTFWENYDSKSKEIKDYSTLTKELFTFCDIISFWQFWNNYPGNDPKKIFFDGENIKYFFKQKYRVNAVNLFQKGIKPEWEDEKNKKGNILTLSYSIKLDQIDDFLEQGGDLWVKLICLLIGETLPYSKYINGIRFVDKTKIVPKILISFKYEIWVNPDMKENELNELKEFCFKEFGCQGTIKTIN